DTNIFIYSALDHPKYGNPCTQLIHEVESGKTEGYIPTIVLNELLHRLMIAEVIERGLALNTGDAIRILKKDKNTIQSLAICWNEIDRLFDMGFIILKEKINTLAESLIISHRYSLLATDAYIVSFAKSYNIENIITNDIDFERVEWLKVWKP
ncbi:MAG: PIN domain-containing protein, partial [Candidatus Methanoperedens sp.]|nr:PIN domain-containing protein [Candidatus Methanoperedens sp.]